MNYVPFSQRITGLLNQIPGYEVITFSLNVDGTACFLMKYQGERYYQEHIPYLEMKKDNSTVLMNLVARVEKWFKTDTIRVLSADIKPYPQVAFDRTEQGATVRVEYSAGKFYQGQLSLAELDQDAQRLAELVVARVEAYFTGWAVRKGIRQV